MKVPFSYRHRFFSPVLASSFLAHALFLGAGGLAFMPLARFAVEQAPSSMEVVIFEEENREQDKVSPEKVMILQEPAAQSPEVRQARDENEAEKVKKTIVTPRLQGARENFQDAVLRNPAPVYPNFAREQGWEGLVLLRVLVGRDGMPLRLLVVRSSGYKILDESALRAVRQWRFQPARLANVSFHSWIRIPIRFSLTDRPYERRVS